MKLKNVFLVMMVSVATIWSCDKITNPLLPTQQNSSLPHRSPDFTDDNSATYKTYKVLLEDCMGHLCDNCPAAVITADGLIDPSNSLSSHIVMIEDHMGSFADTTTKNGFPDSSYRKDYTSIAGNYWCTNIFNPGSYPAGYINRKDSNGGTYNYNYANWQNAIQTLVNQNLGVPPVEILIHDSCWVPERIIGVELKVTFTKALPGNYNLETLIVEDSIFDWQLDNLVQQGYSSNFDHRNVLRGAFGDTTGGLNLGIGIPTTYSSNIDSTWTSYQTYDFIRGEHGKADGKRLSLAWKMNRCYIVAFVFNAATNQVVQAEMIKVE